MSKLSQAIAEGDGISFIVEVADAASARSAESQGADGLAAHHGVNAVRVSSQLPLLHLGRMFDASGAAADAVVIKPDLAMWDEAHALGLECVVRVSESEDLERALHHFDPEVFLLPVRGGLGRRSADRAARAAARRPCRKARDRGSSRRDGGGRLRARAIRRRRRARVDRRDLTTLVPAEPPDV